MDDYRPLSIMWSMWMIIGPSKYLIYLFLFSELASAFALIISIWLCGWLLAPLCTFFFKLLFTIIKVHPPPPPFYLSTFFNSRILIGVWSSIRQTDWVWLNEKKEIHLPTIIIPSHRVHPLFIHPLDEVLEVTEVFEVIEVFQFYFKNIPPTPTTPSSPPTHLVPPPRRSSRSFRSYRSYRSF